MKVLTKIAWSNIKVLLIAGAILDLEARQRGEFRILPSLNPYYYKIKSIQKSEENNDD